MINFDQSLLFNLQKANLDLWLKTCQLWQQGRHQWLALDEKIVTDQIEETQAQREQLSEAASWQDMMSLPSDAMWRRVYTRLDEMQVASSLFLSSRAAFSSEYQQALAEWQKASARALNEVGNAMPVQAMFKDFWRSFGALGLSATKAATTQVATPKNVTAKPAQKKAAA